VTLAYFLLDTLPDGPALALSGAEGHHAADVARVRVGERIQVGDGLGSVADCEVAALSKGRVEARILDRRYIPAPAHTVVVVQALAKGDRGQLAVETMTELGVDIVVPWSAARSIVQWRDGRADKSLARWRATAREAAKQSRRAWHPTVQELHGTAAVADRIAAADWAAVLHEDALSGLLAAPLPRAGTVLLVVGPEGGLAPDELDAFHGAGAGLAKLGDSVLRTSTAGAAAIAALSPALHRWA
jgi:16S rRNA (uracil1498-N3)-methyltransferase